MYEQKVKYLSAKNLRAYLSAMEKLLAHYKSKEEPEIGYHCPLCDALGELGDDSRLSCFAKKVRCPWYVFTKSGCVSSAIAFSAALSDNVELNIYVLSSKSAYRWGSEKDKEITKLWVAYRIAQLPEWIEAYKAELARRVK